VLSLAKALGIPHEGVTGLFDAFNPGAMIPTRIRRVIEADYSHPTWTLAMARKDARIMMEEAARAGIPLAVLPSVAREMDRRMAEGHGQDDWTVIAKEAV
jgi:3-hydroxyisobutyrate dehydrogenase